MDDTLSDISLKSSNNNEIVDAGDFIEKPSKESYSDNMNLKVRHKSNDDSMDANGSRKKNTGFSFTIDFDEKKSVDSRKLKEIGERFQFRQQKQQEQRQHRRGVSMSKLNENAKASSKRHSWSPCSNHEKITQPPNFDHEPVHNIPKKSNQFQPKSATLQRALQNIPLDTKSTDNTEKKLVLNSTMSSEFHNEELTNTPLEYIKSSDDEGSIGAISETGTYTVDGDNYTEEEKERMSIDVLNKVQFDPSIEYRNLNESLRNTFQANYTLLNSRDTTKRKISPRSAAEFRQDGFDDRSRTRSEVLNSQSRKKGVSGDETGLDRGVFTSVTACGVLDKQNHEKSSPNSSRGKYRKNSLTKLQIDSSEYIQPKLNQKLMCSYTDYEKAQHNEYQLNIFSTTSSYTSSTSTSQTDDEILTVECIENMSNSMKTAQTKNDWIQEWAKNARRRNNVLSNSVTNTSNTKTDIDLSKSRKPQVLRQVLRNNRMTKSYDTSFCNQFSEENIEGSTAIVKSVSESIDESSQQRSSVNNFPRPPMSPTKIPSPRRPQNRVRSSSTSRTLYNDTVSISSLSDRADLMVSIILHT